MYFKLIEINFINALIQNGVNTIRLRLWVNPADESSSLEEVKEFSNELRSRGFKIWITPHFSDTWAHPGQQQIPSNWESLSFEELKNQLYAHTYQIMNEINPDYIQIGNEINTGILLSKKLIMILLESHTIHGGMVSHWMIYKINYQTFQSILIKRY